MLNATLVQVTPLLAKAAIDIDGTVLVQMVLFLTVIVALHVLLIQPYMKAVEARKEGVQGSREEATEMQAAAEKRIAEYEERMRTARRDAADVRESLRNQGLKEQNELMEEARQEVSELLDVERARIGRSVAEATHQLQERAHTLAASMVDKLVARG